MYCLGAIKSYTCIYRLIDNDGIEILLPNSLTKLIVDKENETNKGDYRLLLSWQKQKAGDEKSKNKTNPSYPWPTRPTIPGHQTHTCWDDDSICQPTTFVCFILFVHALSGFERVYLHFYIHQSNCAISTLLLPIELVCCHFWSIRVIYLLVS